MSKGRNVNTTMDDSELRQFAEKAKEVISAGPDAIAVLEECGVQLVGCDYHSPIPTLKEIDESWELTEKYPYLEPKIFNNQRLLHFLSSCLVPYSAEFAPPHTETEPGTYYWSNPNFNGPDAMAYYCMIRYLRPKRIIEVGAGYSSMVALAALRANGEGALTLIDPYPLPALRAALSRETNVPVELIDKAVQQMPLSFFESLAENDILFIDSTHTVKTGGDCILLYLKVVPYLRHGVAVQVHDIFLPDMMPGGWLKRQLYWVEQYLLHAYLLDNNAVEVIFPCYYHSIFNSDELKKLMAGKAGAHGGSFWFRRIEPAAGTY